MNYALNKKVNVIGLGYIGLPTALMFAKNGVSTVGTDYNAKLIENLNLRRLTFKEDGLEELFAAALKNGVSFSVEYQKADFYIVAVPTPYAVSSKKMDPKYVISAVNSILDICEKEAVIIIESTISPGTIDKYIRPELIKRGLADVIRLVHAPERIIPGKMVFELENNSRIIGADDRETGELVKDLYSAFCKSEIVVTDIKTAEMTKVIENTYRDVNIAFANELAKICRYNGTDVYEIINIANKHPRVNILQPGPGAGGHCISVDPWFLVGDYPDLTNLILAARKVNDSMPAYVLSRLRTIMQNHKIADTSKIGLYGLSYKENIDDPRESPTLQLLNKMSDHLASGIKVFDPFFKTKLVDCQFLDFSDFLKEIEIIVIMTAHDHIKENMDMIKNKIIFDTRNICEFDGVYKL